MKVINADPAVPFIDVPGDCAEEAAQVSGPGDGQRANQEEKEANRIVEDKHGGLIAKADFFDALVETGGTGDDFYFHAEVVNIDVTAVQLGEADGIFLCGDDEFGAPVLAAVDDVQDFLLGVAVMVGKAFRINELGSQGDQAFFETFRLGDARETGYFFASDKGEIINADVVVVDVDEIFGVVDALNDGSVVIVLGDALSQGFGLAVALSDKDDGGAVQMFVGFAEGSSGEQTLDAKGLLSVNEDDILAATIELPVLKAVIQEEGVAAEILHGKAAAFHAVFIDQNNDVFEVGSEHERFIAGLFAIEHEGLAVGDDFGRRRFTAEKEGIKNALEERFGFGAVAAREDGDFAVLVCQFACELLDNGGFAGAAHSQVANGDNLDAQGGVSQDTDFIEELSDFNDSLEENG